MSRRSAPPLYSTDACLGHRPYRSKADATYRASWHLPCPKCRAGRPFRAWEHDGHFHVGHKPSWMAP